MSTERVLEGVPRVAFAPIHGGQYELTPFPSCLKSVLTYLGRPVSYPCLMGATAAAFRFVWRSHGWDPGNVDIVHMESDPLAPFLRGFRAAGLEPTIMVNSSVSRLHAHGGRRPYVAPFLVPDEATFRTTVVDRIDAGIPLIALGVVGPPEACIITGYRDGGASVTGWSMFQPPGGSDAGEGSFERAGWFADTHALFALSPITPPTCEESYAITLPVIARILSSVRAHEYLTGLAALDAYIDHLTNDSEFHDLSDAELAERKMVHYDAMTMIAERAAGAIYLRDADLELRDELRLDQAEALVAAAEACERASREMRAWWDVVGPIHGDEAAEVRATADHDVRMRFAEHVRAARGCHENAARVMGEAFGGP